MEHIIDGSREYMVLGLDHRHPGVLGMLRNLAWAHLPENLQAYSRPCGELALQMVRSLPDDAELVAGLRKLMEAKDCFVRAAL